MYKRMGALSIAPFTLPFQGRSRAPTLHLACAFISGTKTWAAAPWSPVSCEVGPPCIGLSCQTHPTEASVRQLRLRKYFFIHTFLFYFSRREYSASPSVWKLLRQNGGTVSFHPDPQPEVVTESQWRQDLSVNGKMSHTSTHKAKLQDQTTVMWQQGGSSASYIRTYHVFVTILPEKKTEPGSSRRWMAKYIKCMCREMTHWSSFKLVLLGSVWTNKGRVRRAFFAVMIWNLCVKRA